MLVESLNGADNEDEEMEKNTRKIWKQERRQHQNSWPMLTECHNF